MHFVKVKGIISPNGGMNIYRGCTHGCIYCDSRSKCYQINHQFEDIEVKENALELLEATLQRKRKKIMIGTGSMTDPYNHVDDVVHYTRKALAIIEKYGFGVTVLTKSNKVLNDLDILERIAKKSKAVVQMTLTCYDEEICKIIEPHVSTTKERFEALKILNQHNIPTIVWLDPILPYITDTLENLQGILRYCIEAKVKGIICFGMGLTLREGNREYFYEKLDEHFLGLRLIYERNYGLNYEINSPYNSSLMKVFQRVCEENGIMHDVNEIFSYLHEMPKQYEFQQLMEI